MDRHARGATNMLSFAFPDTPYAVILGYDDDGLREYYINLESPLAALAPGYDTVEHLLDVDDPARPLVVVLEGRGRARGGGRAGLFSEEDAAWFRYWGERAVEHVLLREPPVRRGLVRLAPRPRLGRADPAPDWDLVPV